MLSSEVHKKTEFDRNRCIRVDEAYCISHWYVHVSQAFLIVTGFWNLAHLIKKYMYVYVLHRL